MTATHTLTWSREDVIAQDDDGDYSESGYVVCRRGDICVLAHYSHCSCFGTFDAFDGLGGILWEGTWDELVKMAVRKADPDIPNREASTADCDYDHLMRVYEQIVALTENNGRQ